MHGAEDTGWIILVAKAAAVDIPDGAVVEGDVGVVVGMDGGCCIGCGAAAADVRERAAAVDAAVDGGSLGGVAYDHFNVLRDAGTVAAAEDVAGDAVCFGVALEDFDFGAAQHCGQFTAAIDRAFHNGYIAFMSGGSVADGDNGVGFYCCGGAIAATVDVTARERYRVL